MRTMVVTFSQPWQTAATVSAVFVSPRVSSHANGCAVFFAKNKKPTMAQTNSSPRDWTDAEDRYLIENMVRLSPSMIGEDLDRTATAVVSRIKRLRTRGTKLPTIPAGRRPGKDVDLDTNRRVVELNLPETVERIAIRDEVIIYLRDKVIRRKLTLKRAKFLLRSINRSVLQSPPWKFEQYRRKSVELIVQEAA
jgi:hypothetical protein